MIDIQTLPHWILDSIPVPIRLIQLNNTGMPVYRYFNQVACTTAGFTLDEVLGKSAAELFPNEWGREATQKHVDVLQAREPLTYIHQMPLVAGMRTLQTTLVPLSIDDDTEALVVGTTIDITAQLTNETASFKAESLHQEILRFTELAAHDLRTPMRQVTALTGMLRENFKDMGDGKIDVLDKIQLVSERTMSLITNLLSTSKEFSAFNEVEEFYLGELSADLFVMLDPLRHHTLPKETALITADKAAVQIVLRNLIDNALKHNYPDAIDVHIGVAENRQSKMLTFTVEDNGKGFTNLTTAFETNENASECNGFGLPAIRRLVNSRGGTIRLEAQLNKKGATIVFTLPGVLKHQCSVVDFQIAI